MNANTYQNDYGSITSITTFFWRGGGVLVHIIFLNDRLLKWDKIILSQMFRWFQAMGSKLNLFGTSNFDK